MEKPNQLSVITKVGKVVSVPDSDEVLGEEFQKCVIACVENLECPCRPGERPDNAAASAAHQRHAVWRGEEHRKSDTAGKTARKNLPIGPRDGVNAARDGAAQGRPHAQRIA